MPIPLSSEVSVQPDAEKTELMQCLEYAFPSKSQSQLLHMDVDSRIRAMLTVFMPEEYEGQHQLTQTNRLSIELYLRSNNLTSYNGLGRYKEQEKRLLAMIRTFGWHRGGQFKTLQASQEPTVEAIAERIFASAVFRMDIEVVKQLLEAGMDSYSVVEDSNGRLITPLQWVATITDSRGAKMAELLVSHKTDIELVPNGGSGLFEAIFQNNKIVIELLLRRNVVVSLWCLAEATGTVDANLFENLLTSCPNVNGLIYDTIIKHEARGAQRAITLLGAAAKSGRLEIIKTILRVYPSLVNPRALETRGGAYYCSPISVAIANNNTEALKALLDAGVDTHLVNEHEKPPIEQVLERNNLRAYEILVKSGARITQPLSYKSLHVFMTLISGEGNYLSTMEHLINESARLSRNVTEWSGEVLAEAINHDDLLVIRLLLDSGATVVADEVTRIGNQETAQYLDTLGALQALLDESGPAILLDALVRLKWDLAWWLLIREPVLLDESLYDEPTPLSSAARSKQPKLVRFMLRHGARVTDRALFMATRCIREDYIEGVSSDEGFEVLRILLSHFNGPAPSAIAEAVCDLIGFDDMGDDTDQDIGDCTDFDDIDEDIYLLEFLLSEGVEPTGTPEVVFDVDWHGLYEPQSALEVVVASGNRLALEILTQTPYNWGAKALGRALAVACNLRNEDLIDLILKRKPDMNEGVAFWRYLPEKRVVTFSTALQVAARLQKASVIRKLLVFGDTDVNYPAKGPFGRTALQHAVENGNLELITMLLSHDADVNGAPATNGGATALQLAAIKGYLGIARRLLDLGADVNAPGAVIDGRTALEGAAEHGRINMVHMFLDEGALIFGDAGEEQYNNAVALARKKGKYAVARMLERFKSKMEQAHMQTSGISVVGGEDAHEGEEGSNI